MVTLNDILEGVKAYHPEADLDIIKHAYEFSAQRHAKQTRRTGEPFLIHPIEVAMILVHLKLDVASIAAGLLHDTVEDTHVTLEEVEKEFGPAIANLVDGLTKLSKLSFRTSREKQAENFRKMILAMAKDIRVILIKLADRLHNMRTLEALAEEKQQRIAQETLEIYAPLANRLGISWIKSELEDLSLRYLKPDMYYRLVQQVAKKKKEREKYIELVRNIISEKLSQYNIHSEVSGRSKHLYSVYKKMEKQHIDFEHVYDLIAFRILVETLPQCYETLGIIHSVWTPVPGRFKDYIAMPKANRYQSLHTTVIGPYGERIEIQIRTKEMHNIAEEGIAAHWKYKEGEINKYDEERFKWLRALTEWQKELKDPSEFLETLRIDLFDEEVYVFTPRGDVKEFPKGATPIDFAYAVHTDVGNHCVGAKVNGRIVPLKYKLKSGDTIEIVTNESRHPSKDWLDLVVTSRAKAKIRSYIKGQEREEGAEIGRSILAKELRRGGYSPTRYLTSGHLTEAAQKLKLESPEDVLIKVGYGFFTPAEVIRIFLPDFKHAEAKKGEREEKSGIISKILQGTKAPLSLRKDAIAVKGVGQVLIRVARCCTPLPGDPVSGFVTRGRGVTVHRADCSLLLSHDAERKVDVEWSETRELRRNIKIKVICADKPGLLMEMSNVFTSNSINIANARVRTTHDKKAINIFEVTVSDASQVKKILKQLEKIEGVVSAARL
ncbi:MAG: bifunctional (p)ppGpp synthetase/guanosine-3',5'-bis(diphosphate) 3'-pyrophosphohydrolase [Deltaproteobacteria bacterium]|nr:bifunctional (p)ppGpp synthetase/guanosine-3',5'-bis(diphosphate) 3'-pyrophosphohydrolase [Deltaproteobacteria bacterium]